MALRLILLRIILSKIMAIEQLLPVKQIKQNYQQQQKYVGRKFLNLDYRVATLSTKYQLVSGISMLF